MTVTYEDFLKMQWGRKQAVDPRQKEQQTAVRLAGIAMEELVNEPRWKFYLDHVAALQESAEQLRKAAESRLLDQEDSKARNDYHYQKGVVWGLQNAVLCAKMAIRNGEKASEALKKGVKQGTKEDVEGNVRRNQETS